MTDNTVLKILKSRFKKNEDKETKQLRSICKFCEFNSKNLEEIPIKKRLLIFLSNALSWITGRYKEDNLGNCTACESCSIYFKTLEYDWEDCPKGYWKSKYLKK